MPQAVFRSRREPRPARSIRPRQTWKRATDWNALRDHVNVQRPRKHQVSKGRRALWAPDAVFEEVLCCGGGAAPGRAREAAKEMFSDACHEIWQCHLGEHFQRSCGSRRWRKSGQWQAAHRDGFHVLRHTYASVVLEAGESVVTLARWLGHSSPTITLNHYAHFMPEAGGKRQLPRFSPGLTAGLRRVGSDSTRSLDREARSPDSLGKCSQK
ncbi:tyrosine-type recombinase/integrase [Streptomyces sp. NPDC087297]|uniref:tyrosine-type recombinase/integrase n=1 Tax=Streptomyces sp. NPDC087297 TaxID=3365778 RepID=UPI0038097698